MTEGPPLERLMQRLAQTPDAFLAEPRAGVTGQVVTAALVVDAFHALGLEFDATDLSVFAGTAAADRNRLTLVAIVVWLIADEALAAAARPTRPVLMGLLGERVTELAAAGKVQTFVNDVERREELARTTLAALDLIPAGESEAQSRDRLSAVSAVERRRLVRASQEAEARARAVREALIRKAAQEAADKATRE